jgi:hypothetical protein
MFLPKQKYPCKEEDGGTVGRLQLAAGQYDLVWDNRGSTFMEKPIHYAVFASVGEDEGDRRTFLTHNT